MDRTEFERLRDLSGKRIEGNIVLQRSKNLSPLLLAKVSILNDAGVTASLRIELNEQTDAKTLNVTISDVGPVCRLEVDSRPHKKIGRSHKHSLKLPDCPHSAVNLSRDICERNDLNGKSIQEVFTDFCKKANICFDGTLTLAS